MHRILATLLLICFGIIVPVAASSARFCALDGKLLMPGFSTSGEATSASDKGCADCGSTDEGDSCCHDVKKLPDASQPSWPMALPPLYFCELSGHIVLPACPVTDVDKPFTPAAPIRGPDSPGLRRALLGIWNI